MNNYSYAGVSGLNSETCDVIGHVSHPEDSRLVQSYALRFTPGRMSSVVVIETMITDVWTSPTGRTHFVDANGCCVWTGEPDSFEKLRETKLDFVPHRIFGLDDEHVYVMGGLRKEMRMCRWDGREWKEMPAPARQMWGLHGCAPDCLVAVGSGIASRWDGHQWHAMDTEGAAMLTSVWVESPDEMYACGDGRVLMQGSAYGWSPVLRHDATLASVAKWQGEVWVGAYGDLGLSKLQDNQLVSIKPNLLCATLDARDELVFQTNSIVGSTGDGQSFMGRQVSAFERFAKEGTPPSWWDAGW